MRPEQHHARLECPDVGRWTAPDIMASEVEVSEFLAHLVRLLKPEFVVETGTYQGDTAAAIGHALSIESTGQLVTLEVDADLAVLAQSRVKMWPVTVLNQPAMSYTPPRLIDLLFVDSGEYRMEEIRYFQRWASPRCVIVCHDTQQESLRRELDVLHKQGVTKAWVWLPTPRGLGLSRYP